VSGGLAQSGLGPAEFAATLDIVDAADLTESVDPAPLVSAYIKSVGAGAYGLSANRISESAAASFVRLAMRMSEAVRRSFFAPVDVRSRIAAAAEPEVNPYTIEDETARSLRAHIHILCRAVAGLKESSPKELTAALIELSERVPPASLFPACTRGCACTASEVLGTARGHEHGAASSRSGQTRRGPRSSRPGLRLVH
jgi:hypothetical protein